MPIVTVNVVPLSDAESNTTSSAAVGITPAGVVLPTLLNQFVVDVQFPVDEPPDGPQYKVAINHQ